MKTSRSKLLNILYVAIFFALALSLIGGKTIDVHADTHAHEDGVNRQCWNTDDSLPNTEGWYYLDTDVTLSSSWIVPTGFTYLCLNGHVIKTNGGEFSVITVGEGSNIMLEDCTNTTEHKGYFDVDGLWHLGEKDPLDEGETAYSIYGGLITGGNATTELNPYGGGINCCFDYSDDVYLGLSNVTIAGNKATTGGGIMLNYYESNPFGSGLVIMGGANIIGNTATNAGGGIYVSARSALMMEGGSISYNTAKNSDNNAVGGGLCVGINSNNEAGLLDIHGGNIEHNYADLGGGIYVCPFAEGDGEVGFYLDMSSFNVRYNTAIYGGGIYNNGRITINAIDYSFNVVENTATGAVGGLFNNDYVDLNFATIVKDNVCTATYGDEDEFTYPANLATTKELHTAWYLTGSDISVTHVDSNYKHNSGAITKWYASKNASAGLNGYFNYEGPSSFVMGLNSSGDIEITEPKTITNAKLEANKDNNLGYLTIDKTEAMPGETVTITINANTGCDYVSDSLVASYNDGTNKTLVLTSIGNNQYTFTMPAYAVSVTAKFKGYETHDGITFESWDSTDSLPDEPGNYFLLNDVTLNETWTVPSEGVNLCLNGKVINLNGDYNVREYTIFIPFEGTLAIYDHDTTTVHKFYNDWGLWVLDDTLAEPDYTVTGGVITGGVVTAITMETNSTLIINGGNIVGNYNIDKGGAIAGGGLGGLNPTIILNNGKICGNKAGNQGGAIYISGTVVMNGGEISYNDEVDYALYLDLGGSLILNDGIISHNEGGAIYTYGGTIEINGGEISNNVNYSDGGGAIFASLATIIINGGEISYNEAYMGMGGAIYLSSSRMFFNDGLITHNYAEVAGGALYLTGNAAVIMYDGEMSYNESFQSGGAVYISFNTDFIMHGGLIKNNTADVGGAVAVAYNAYFGADGGMITGNNADICGGGVYVSNRDGDPYVQTCLAEGTLITLADGSTEVIEYTYVGQEIRVFDHATGQISTSYIYDWFEFDMPKEDAFTLHFTNGIDVTAVGGHCFFEQEANKYVTITIDNYSDFIGKKFYNVDDARWETLNSVTELDEPVKTYILVTEHNYNAVANGMLSNVDGLYGVLCNIFDFGDNLTWDATKKANDITTYGTWNYDTDHFHYVSEETYEALDLQYLGVAIGKGLLTLQELQKAAENTLLYNTDIVSPLAFNDLGIYLGGTFQILENTCDADDIYADFVLYNNFPKINLGTGIIGNNILAPKSGMHVNISVIDNDTGELCDGIFAINATSDSKKYFFTNDGFVVRYNDNGTENDLTDDFLEHKEGYKITNNSKEEDKVANHGYVSIENTDVFAGDTIVVELFMDDNCKLISLKYNDGISDHTIEKNNDVYSFTMPNKNVTVTAVIEPIVAWVGGQSYTSIDAAINKVSNGGTIQIAQDFTCNGFYTKGKSFTITPLKSDVTITITGSILIGDNGGDSTITLKGSGDYKLTIKADQTGADPVFRPISMRSGNTLVINDGVILTDSEADHFGGGMIYVANEARLEMNGGLIKNSKSLTDDYDNDDVYLGRGGAIYVAIGGTFLMTGGEIKDCSATVAGGAIYSAGTVAITGGKITNCTVLGLEDNGVAKAKGGAVYAYRGYFAMVGGEITGNTLASVEDMRGAGVYVASGVDVRLGGVAQITGNTDGDDNASNLFLYDGVVVTIDNGYYPDEDMLIGVSTKTLPSGTTTVKLTANGIVDFDLEYFVSDKNNCIIKLNDNGTDADPTDDYYELVRIYSLENDTPEEDKNINYGYITVSNETACTGDVVAVTVFANDNSVLKSLEYLCGGDSYTAFNVINNIYYFNVLDDDGEFVAEFAAMVAYNETKKVGYESLADAVNAASDGDVISIIEDQIIPSIQTGDKSLTFKASGKDVEITITGSLLFGNNYGDRTFILAGGDKGETLTIKADQTDATPVFRPIGIRIGNTLIIKDGVIITDSTEDYFGGAIIHVGKNATLDMQGGIIKNGNAISDDYDSVGVYKGRGGAIYVAANGTFKMSGGEIKDCTASVAGGAIYSVGNIIITGGKITNCTVTGLEDGEVVKAKGGAIYIYSGTFTMYGGEITGNTLEKVADMRGAGVYVASGATVTLGKTAKIYGNTDGDDIASNLFLYDNVEFIIGEEDYAPATGMNVGVTTKTAPGKSSPVQISANAVKADKAYFSADIYNEYIEFVTDCLMLYADTDVDFDPNYVWNNGDDIYYGDDYDEIELTLYYYDEELDEFDVKGIWFDYYLIEEDDETLLSDMPTLPGNYKVVISVSDSFYTGSLELTFSILKLDNEISDLEITGWIYGEDPNSPSATALYGDIVYSYATEVDGDYSTTVPTNAGSYYVKAEVLEGDTYKGAYDITSLLIEKADAVIDVTNVETVYTYNGTEQVINSGATLNHNETALEYSYNTFTDVGEYTITIYAEETDNYNSGIEYVDIVVNKGTNAISNLSISGWTYGESNNVPTANATFGLDTIVYTFSTEENGEYDGDVPENAGTYYVKATIPATDNYDEVSAKTQFTISQKTILDLDFDVIEHLTYNGYEQEFGINSIKYGEIVLVEDKDYEVRDNKATNYDEMGYYMTIEGIGNYCGQTSIQFFIDKYEITINWVDDDFTYNGASQLDSLKPTYTDVFGDEHELDIISTKKSNLLMGAPSSFFNAGIYSVEIYRFTDDGSYNYTLPDFESCVKQYTMKKADLTIIAYDYSINYNEDPGNNGVEISGFVAEETIDVLSGELAYAYNYAKGNNAGDYEITPSGLTSDNYNITYYSGVLTVNKLNESVAITNDISKAYDGQAVSAPTYTNLGDGVVTVQYKLASQSDSFYTTTAPTNAGSYIVKVSVAEATNYNSGSATKEFTIAKKDITLEVVDILTGITYDGEAHTTTATYSGLAGTDALTYELAYSDNVNAGTCAVTIKSAAITAGTADNYNVITTDTGSIVIGKKDITLEVVDILTGITYNGEAHTTTASYSGLVGTDALSYELAYSNNYSAGTCVVTIKSAAITSGLATNYNLITTDTGSIVIGTKDVIVEVVDILSGVIYDGYEHETAAVATGLYGTDQVAYDLEYTDNVNAGTCVVTIKSARISSGDPANYNVIYSDTGSLVICPKTIIVKVVDVTTGVTYDGQAHTTTVVATGLINEEIVDYVLEYTDNVNAGECVVSIKSATITNGTATNYNLDITDTGFIVIGKRSASLEIVDISSGITYDGKAHTTTANVYGLVGDDQVTYELEYVDNVNAGECVVSIKSASVTTGIADNYNLSYSDMGYIVIDKLAVNEPTITKSYKYTGSSQTVEVNGVESYMTTTDSLTQTEVGVYTITYTLDDNHLWAKGSDGKLTWEIKATSISTKEEEIPGEEPKKQDVIVETEEGFASDITVTVEVTVEVEIEAKSLTVDYYDLPKEEIKLGKNEKVGVVFDVKLIQIINGEEVVIQPSDIAPGTRIKVKMLIPESVDIERVTRILHVHSSDDIESFEFDASKVDENGYYEMEVDRLSEFAFIYEENKSNLVLILLIILLVVGAGLFYLFYFYLKKELYALISCGACLVASIVLTCFAEGAAAIVFAIIDILTFAGGIAYILLRKYVFKKEAK